MNSIVSSTDFVLVDTKTRSGLKLYRAPHDDPRDYRKPKTGLRVYTHVRESEKELLSALRNSFPMFISKSDKEILYDIRMTQRNAETVIPCQLQGQNSIFTSLLSSATVAIERAFNVKNRVAQSVKDAISHDSVEFVMNIFETVPIVLTLLTQVSSTTGVITTLIAGLKMILGRSLIMSAIDYTDIVGKWIETIWPGKSDPTDKGYIEIQSGESEGWNCWTACEEILEAARFWIDNVAEIPESPLFKRFEKLFKYFLVFGVCTNMGLSFENFDFSAHEEKKIRETHRSKIGFLFTICDSIIWILQRSMQSIALGAFTPFYHSSQSYTRWAENAYRLMEDEEKLQNTLATGIDYNDFLHRLSNSLEEGEVMYKFAAKGHEKTVMAQMMSKMRLLKARRQTADAARAPRDTPDSILVYGGTSVGKSKFVEVLHAYYGELKDMKDKSSGSKYTRCFSDKYWSEWRSHMWCILVDDLALQKHTLGIVDASLQEIIQIINNVTFCPPQAGLDEKGKNPVIPRLVIGTTNTEHLNAFTYFSCSVAVQRRFPYIVEVAPLPAYCRMENGVSTGMLDPTLIPPALDGEYPNIWKMTLKQVYACTDHSQAVIEPIATFEDINLFLAAWGAILKSREECQKNDKASTHAMGGIGVCKKCFMPSNHCVCGSEVQVGSFPMESLLHDEDPKKWIVLTLSKIRDSEWVEQPVVEECCAKLQISEDELYSKLTRIQGGAHVVSPDESVADVFSDLLELARLDYICDAYLKIKYNLYNSHLCVRLREDGLKEVATEFQGFINGHLCITAYRISKSAEGVFTWVKHQLTDNVVYDTISGFAQRQKILICTMARLMANGIKVEWNAATEPLVAYATFRIGLYSLRVLKEQFFMFGERVAQNLNNPKVWVFLTVLAAAYPVYKAITNLMTPRIQGQEPSKIPVDGKTNLWESQDEFRLCDFDIGGKTVGSKSQVYEETRKRIARNVVHIISEAPGRTPTCGRAVCLIGHLYMTPSHILRSDTEYLTVIDSDCGSQGLKSSLRFKFNAKTAKKDMGTDLCFFTCFLPPKADICEFFPKRTLQGGMYKGDLLSRAKSGTVELNPANKIHMDRVAIPSPIDKVVTSWVYTPGQPTRAGDCGSLLCANSGKGVILMGMHQTYNHIHGGASAIAVTSEMLVTAKNMFDVQIQGTGPDLAGKPLHELHWKSVMRDLTGSAKIFGSFGKQNFRAAPKTRVQKTVVCDAAVDEGFEIKHGAPTMKGPEPWKIAAQPCAEISGKIDEEILDECVAAFTEDIWNGLKDTHYIKELGPLNDEETVNGIPGVRFIDKMKRDTSMGFPWKKSKRHYLREMEENLRFQDGVEFTEEIMEHVEEVRRLYREGKSASPIFSACLKDEPVTFKKQKMGKTRVFLNAPLPFSFVVRQNLLPFVRVFQSNPFLFEAAVGINHNSHQWEELRTYLTYFGDLNVAGDYGNYDKRMYALMILKAFGIIRAIMKRAGCTEEQLLAVACIAEDTAYAWIDFQGDLVQFFGSNPSGHPLTVVINSIVNALYMRYCYYSLNPQRECRTFKEFVHLITYGDDNEQNVSPTIQWYNHTAIQKVLADIDVVYTMADKDAESKPFIPFVDVSFLKRKWVFDEESQIWQAPLEWDSINKMLTIGTRSDSVAPEEQASSMIESAALEMWHHGPSAFEEGIGKLQRIVKKSNLSSWMREGAIKTWSEYVELHKRCSLGFSPENPDIVV